MHNRDVTPSTAPIQAWYVTATSNEISTMRDDPNSTFFSTAMGGGSVALNPKTGRSFSGGGAVAQTGFPGGSRISTRDYSEFAYVTILVNSEKVAGHPIGPIADYIAMLALAEAKAPDNCSELASILDYLAPDCSEKPQSLTYADKAYLEG